MLKLKIIYEGQFKRDYKLAVKRGLNPGALAEVVSILADKKSLPPKNRDHKLVSSRRYKNMRECHIEPDWLLIYQVVDDALILRLVRTGTHSDLF